MHYLTVEDVISFHEAEVDADTIVDFGVLESAVLRPQQTIAGQDAYPDIHAKAAALFHSLVRNHPFVDGNKRTGVLSLAVFYRINGYLLAADDADIVALALDAAEGLTDVEAISKELATWAHPQPLDD